MSVPIHHAVIACHPAEDSFVLAMAGRYVEAVRAHHHEVVFRDLYRCGFDPVLRDEERRGHPGADALAELARVSDCDIFTLVYPIWFGGPPAMLKGYIDRVFGAGRILGATDASNPGFLAGKRLVTLTSSGSMKAWLDEHGVMMSMRNLFARYLADLFGLEGTEQYHFDGVTPEAQDWEIALHLGSVDSAARQVMGHYAFPSRSNPSPPGSE